MKRNLISKVPGNERPSFRPEQHSQIVKTHAVPFLETFKEQIEGFGGKRRRKKRWKTVKVEKIKKSMKKNSRKTR